jgi:lipopolysaccharide heptosyltransferase II
MKILVVTKNWLGDILFEMPALDMIRSRYPGAELMVLTHPRCREMLEHYPGIDRILEFDERGSHRSLSAKIRFVRALRKEGIEAAYFFHRSRTRAFLLKLAGIPKRVGYGVKWPNFLTHAVPDPKRPVHHVDYFVHLLEQAGYLKPEHASYRFYHGAKDRIAVERYLGAAGVQHFACFHLGANWEPKRWPVSHFAKLAELIHQKWRLPVILTGGPGDQVLGEQLMAQVQDANVYDFIGKTSLGELGALFSRSTFVVSGDSGPMHIASGVGARVLAIFGPTHPDLTGPRGKGQTAVLKFVPEGFTSPWYGKELPQGGWLSQITPEQVLETLDEKGWGTPKNNPLKSEAPGRDDAPDDGKNILLITLSNIGDVILTTPVLMTLAAHYPGHRLTVVAGPRAKGVLEGSRFIDRLIIYDKHTGLREKIRFIQELRRRRYEVVVDLKNSAVPFLVSAKKRSPVFRSFHKKAARERHLEVLRQMKMDSEAMPPFDFYNEKDEAAVFAKLRHKGISADREWIAVTPIAASEIKTWPMQHFRSLLEGLLRETPYSIFLLGGEREARMMNPLTVLNPQRIFNLAGQTTLRETAALIGRSKLLVANDSSAAHFGFEMTHPSVILYGPTDPEKWARSGEKFSILSQPVECSPCGQAQCRFERRACLEDLQPEKVLQACLERLEAKAVPL